MKITSTSTFSVGLFWFSTDYKEIKEVRGQKEISSSDLTREVRIEPEGLHAYHDFPREWPRGRLVLVNSVFTIYVGEDCDIDPVPLVKSTFGLSSIDNSKFKIIHHYHWNTK